MSEANFMSEASPIDPGLRVDSLDLEGQGIARRPDGKVVFIEGALPGERVTVQVHRRKNQWEQGVMQALWQAAALRVTPRCPHFGLHAGACGGCKMQHLEPSAQVAAKQRVLEDNLWHLGKVKAETMLAPIHGPFWGYRHRARLSVRHVVKKGQVLIGFHERKSRYIADMHSCSILPPAISDLLLPLRELIAGMNARDTCPQIELACGDRVVALVLRHLEPLVESDRLRLRDFAHAHPGVQWWLQPKGPDTVHLLDPGGPTLAYSLPEFGLQMPFRPTDFTQVNPAINQVLVGTALRCLQVKPTERVIDWFCGLGNFTLPLATQTEQVLGIEGSTALVERAAQNAALNAPALRKAPQFVARNLFEMTPEMLVADGVADKWLIDPPREGAFALVKALADLNQSTRSDWQRPQRVVYVSCNPATLARDAGLMVHQAGYRCTHAGVVNMFPHTAHVESMAVFERV
jgi:23S rRNA (uracil1939-C5)-methyltransferase